MKQIKLKEQKERITIRNKKEANNLENEKGKHDSAENKTMNENQKLISTFKTAKDKQKDKKLQDYPLEEKVNKKDLSNDKKSGKPGSKLLIEVSPKRSFLSKMSSIKGSKEYDHNGQNHTMVELSFGGKSFKLSNLEKADFLESLCALVSLGYEKDIINRIFYYHRCTGLDSIMYYLNKKDDKYTHNFESDEDKLICRLCLLPPEDHTPPNLENIKSLAAINRRLTEIKGNLENSMNLESLEKISLSESTLDCCLICEENLEDSEYFNVSQGLNCCHLFCKDCFEEYIRTKIRNAEVRKITCPMEGCDLEITRKMVNEIFSNEQDLLEKYRKFKKQRELIDKGNYKFCPFPDCNGSALFETVEYPTKLICSDKSKHQFCGKCMKKWHEKQYCNDLNDDMKKWVEEKLITNKQCPKCKAWTEKVSGCNHMTCNKCREQWCWLCEGQYKDNHYSTPGTPCYNRQFTNEQVNNNREVSDEGEVSDEEDLQNSYLAYIGYASLYPEYQSRNENRLEKYIINLLNIFNIFSLSLLGNFTMIKSFAMFLKHFSSHLRDSFLTRLLVSINFPFAFIIVFPCFIGTYIVGGAIHLIMALIYHTF